MVAHEAEVGRPRAFGVVHGVVVVAAGEGLRAAGHDDADRKRQGSDQTYRPPIQVARF